MWIIDDSGPIAELAERVAAVSYDKFVEDVRESMAFALKRKREGIPGMVDPTQEINELGARLSKMDKGDRAMFEAAKSAVLTLLEMVPTSHAGVCARPSKNSTDSPRGQTLSIHVSGYDVR